MAANTNPLFGLTPKAGWATITAANTAKDGTGAVNLLLTAGVNGAYFDKVRAQPLGTNVATVMRFFLNNGSDPTVAANNTLIGEMGLAATTLSEVLAQTTQTFSFASAIPAGYRVYAVLATAVAAGWAAAGLSLDY